MRLHKTAAALILALSMSIEAFAAVNLKADRTLLTISGSSQKPNTETVLIVLKKGITSDSYKASPSADKIEYFWQGTTDDKGNYSFTMYLDENMEYGDYIVTLGDGEYGEEEKYTHVKESDRPKLEVVKLLNGAVNADTIKAILKNNTQLLGINTYMTEAQWNSVSKELLGKAGSFTIDNVNSYVSAQVQSATATEEKPITGGSPGSGGGGGGGGSSAGSAVIGNAYMPSTTLPPVVVTENETTFKDVGNAHYAYEAINSLFEKGIVSGVGNKMYEPDRKVNREEFVQMLYNAFKIDSDTVIEFEDVKSNAWYYESVGECAGKGIIKGITPVLFGVGESLTRQDASVMLHRIAGGVKASKTADYADRNEISDYALDAVDALSEMSVIKGMGNNRFEPFGTLTRAQAAVMIYNLMERMN